MQYAADGRSQEPLQGAGAVVLSGNIDNAGGHHRYRTLEGAMGPGEMERALMPILAEANSGPRSAIVSLAVAMVLVLVSTVDGQPTFDNRWYVDASVVGGDGSDWPNAFADLLPDGAHGAALGLLESTTAVFTNCTFSGNAAPNQGGAFSLHDNASLTLSNCIVWGNCPEQDQINVEGEDVVVAVFFSDVEGGWAGLGNIDQDPKFMDADGPDDTDCTGDEDLRLLAGSPCLDTGRNTLIPDDYGDVDDDGVTSETLPVRGHRGHGTLRVHVPRGC